MSDTPETDAAAMPSTWTTYPDILKNFARLQADVFALGNSNFALASDLVKAKRERDEARKQANDLKWIGVHSCSDTCQRPACVMRRERDEAREALREIAAADWKTSGELRSMARKVLEAKK